MDVNLNTILLIIIIFILIFSPLFVKLQRKLFIKRSKSYKKLSSSNIEEMIDTISDAVEELARTKTGALITFERKEALDDYVKGGQRLNSELSSALLISLFNKHSPLHDGSVIIQGNIISCSSAYFPTSKATIDNRFGARHRAALGLSEVRDSVVITVSETNGSVHIVKDGKMVKVLIENFDNILSQYLK